jgi:hypothetical protein
MTFLDSLPAGVWMYQSGVWMFIPTVASYDDCWAASQFLDDLANAKYEAEKPSP